MSTVSDHDSLNAVILLRNVLQLSHSATETPRTNETKRNNIRRYNLICTYVHDVGFPKQIFLISNSYKNVLFHISTNSRNPR